MMKKFKVLKEGDDCGQSFSVDEKYVVTKKACCVRGVGYDDSCLWPEECLFEETGECLCPEDMYWTPTSRVLVTCVEYPKCDIVVNDVRTDDVVVEVEEVEVAVGWDDLDEDLEPYVETPPVGFGAIKALKNVWRCVAA